MPAESVSVSPGTEARALGFGAVVLGVAASLLPVVSLPNRWVGAAIALALLLTALSVARRLSSALRISGGEVRVRTLVRSRIVPVIAVKGIDERPVSAGPFRGWMLGLSLADRSTVWCWSTASSEREQLARVRDHLSTALSFPAGPDSVSG